MSEFLTCFRLNEVNCASVYINRKGLQSVEIEEPIIRLPLRPGGKATLDIDVINYEAPTHIYLSSRGAIKDKVTFNRNNPYVDGEELLTITVANPPGQQELYEGEVSISTGYGSRRGASYCKSDNWKTSRRLMLLRLTRPSRAWIIEARRVPLGFGNLQCSFGGRSFVSTQRESEE